MSKKDNNNDVEIVRENYNKNAQAEWERLEGFHFEFEITKHYLKRYLRGKTVLDIGGGPGRYSVWLAQQGYDVTLVDLSEGNIKLAKQKFNEFGVQAKVMCTPKVRHFWRCTFYGKKRAKAKEV